MQRLGHAFEYANQDLLDSQARLGSGWRRGRLRVRRGRLDFSGVLLGSFVLIHLREW